MNFDEAIRAHSNWKHKLADYVQKPDRSIDAATLAQDDKCELGRWIHAEAGNHRNNASFTELTKKHADFHRAAADLVRRADSGERINKEVAFCSTSPYASASAQVVWAITKMKQAQVELTTK